MNTYIPVCHFYYTPTGCRNGLNCNFRHVENCPYGQSCVAGSLCWFPHEEDVSKLIKCKNESCTHMTSTVLEYCKPCYAKENLTYNSTMKFGTPLPSSPTRPTKPPMRGRRRYRHNNNRKQVITVPL